MFTLWIAGAIHKAPPTAAAFFNARRREIRWSRVLSLSWYSGQKGEQGYRVGLGTHHASDGVLFLRPATFG
jgi:hypothetical protein